MSRVSELRGRVANEHKQLRAECVREMSMIVAKQLFEGSKQAMESARKIAGQYTAEKLVKNDWVPDHAEIEVNAKKLVERAVELIREVETAASKGGRKQIQHLPLEGFLLLDLWDYFRLLGLVNNGQTEQVLNHIDNPHIAEYPCGNTTTKVRHPSDRVAIQLIKVIDGYSIDSDPIEAMIRSLSSPTQTLLSEEPHWALEAGNE